MTDAPGDQGLGKHRWVVTDWAAGDSLSPVGAPSRVPHTEPRSSARHDNALLRRWLLLRFCMGSFGEPFDGGESLVPLRGEVSHGPSDLVKPVCLYPIENFSTLFAPADKPGLFEHDQMLGDALAREGHPSGQPAGAYFAVADQEVEQPATRWVADGRPQLIVGLRRHLYGIVSTPARRSRNSPHPSRCSSA
jgi:hypothetical protein